MRAGGRAGGCGWVGAHGRITACVCVVCVCVCISVSVGASAKFLLVLCNHCVCVSFTCALFVPVCVR